jgi:hypothetical protein
MADAIYVPCDCGCCVIEVSRHDWGDGDVNYNLAVLDSRYDHEANGLLNRVRRAVMALFGRRVCFNDVYMTEAAFDDLLSRMADLRHGWRFEKASDGA